MRKKTDKITVIKYLKEFLKYLEKNRAKELLILNELGHGFEAWLKVEFVSYCVNFKHYSTLNEDVGIEYKALIKGGKIKQIDIWIKNGLATGNKKYHYIELKNIIADENEGKQLRSWVNDFTTLKKISRKPRKRGERVFPDEVASVLFGVGYTNQKLNDLVCEKLKISKLKPIYLTIDKNIKVAILWCSI